MTAPFAEEASRYFKAGANVLPIATATKVPPAGVAWELWQRRRQTSAELARLVDTYPTADVALILFGLADIETDSAAGERALRALGLPVPPTATWESARGPHRLYRRDRALRTCRLADGLEVRGDGSYSLVPPSAGRRWLIGGLETAVALPPEWPSEWPFRTRQGEGGLALAAAEHLGASVGTRNVTLAALVGHWLTADASARALEQRALTWARRCSPPFPDVEALRVVQSIIRVRERGRSPERAALMLARAHNVRQPARAVLLALVVLWGELGLSEPVLFAPDRKVTDYSGLSLDGARAGIATLVRKQLIEATWKRDPWGRRTRFVRFTGLLRPVLERGTNFCEFSTGRTKDKN